MNKQTNQQKKQIKNEHTERNGWTKVCLSLCCVVWIYFHSKWHSYMYCIFYSMYSGSIYLCTHFLAEPTALRYNYTPQFQCQLIYHHLRPLNIGPDIDLVGKLLCFDIIAYYSESAIHARSFSIWKCLFIWHMAWLCSEWKRVVQDKVKMGIEYGVLATNGLSGKFK